MSQPDPRRLRRARRTSRIAGAIVGVLGGMLYGVFLVSTYNLTTRSNLVAPTILGAALVGSVALALAGPLLSVDAYLWLRDVVDNAPAAQLVGAIAGLLIALLVSVLITVLLSAIPWGVGYMISIGITIALVYIGVRTGSSRPGLIPELLPRGLGSGIGVRPQAQNGQPIVVDTSVLVDGRIVDVSETGFIQGRLLVAAFVLEELQRLADAGDAVRRSRGKRGLDVVSRLQAAGQVEVEVLDSDFPEIPDVDARLVKLSRLRGAALMTNDFNLNRLARIEGIRVLNLNELANAVKPMLSAGESVRITVVKEGREPQQGIGYLEDGTMVIVEGGRRHLEEQVTATVTSVLQSPQGRIIFAAVPSGGEPPRPRPSRSSRVGNR